MDFGWSWSWSSEMGRKRAIFKNSRQGSLGQKDKRTKEHQASTSGDEDDHTVTGPFWPVSVCSFTLFSFGSRFGWCENRVSDEGKWPSDSLNTTAKQNGDGVVTKRNRLPDHVAQPGLLAALVLTSSTAISVWAIIARKNPFGCCRTPNSALKVSRNVHAS